MIQECPVLRPSAAEFQEFRKFVEAVEKTYSKDFGMVKVVFVDAAWFFHALISQFYFKTQVIPPADWRARESSYDLLDQMSLTGPIEQNLFGHAGIFQVLNIEKKSMTYREYRKRSQQN